MSTPNDGAGSGSGSPAVLFELYEDGGMSSSAAELLATKKRRRNQFEDDDLLALPPRSEQVGAVFLPPTLYDLNACGLKLFTFCHDYIFAIDLQHFPRYAELAKKCENAVLIKGTRRSDADLKQHMGNGAYLSFWRNLIIWFVGVVVEHEQKLPFFISDLTSRILQHVHQHPSMQNLLPSTLKMRITKIKLELARCVGAIEYDLKRITLDAMERYFETWSDWPQEQREAIQKEVEKEFQHAKKKAQAKGTYHMATVFMLAMHNALEKRYGTCNTEKLSRVLGVNEKNYTYHPESLRNVLRRPKLEASSQQVL